MTMGLIQDQPEDLPTTNALDAIVDPDEEQGGERAEIYLSGAHVATLDNAPTGAGARVTLMVELEVVEEGHKYKENGDVEVPIRRCKRIGDMWRPGTPKPPTKEEIAAQQAAAKAKAAAEEAAREEAERAEQEHNEPPMFDEDGDPIEPDAVVDAEVVEDDEDQDAGGSNLVQFSDSSKG
ncbi:hypothetical protein SEA_BARKLEY26_44 [Mycobacterium phage Barkley26]|nr:hypothetical protein SEA_BARKLEY26_44 [Mycobacterium phage Barkley26]